MAELLVVAVSASHADPEKDRRGCYKRGDVAVVMEDGHAWGRKEGAPKFRVVKVPGVPAARLRYLTESEEATDPFTAERTPLTRRAAALDLDALPTRTLAESEVKTAERAKVDGRVSDGTVRTR